MPATAVEVTFEAPSVSTFSVTIGPHLEPGVYRLVPGGRATIPSRRCSTSPSPMPDVAAIVADLYVWAARYGLLTDAGMREAAMIRGDPSQVPFDEDEAEFFRLRKIMRIRADELAGRRVVTIFTRQAIAERKVQQLIRAFDTTPPRRHARRRHGTDVPDRPDAAVVRAVRARAHGTTGESPAARRSASATSATPGR